jgi:hypothetical protein
LTHYRTTDDFYRSFIPCWHYKPGDYQNSTAIYRAVPT